MALRLRPLDVQIYRVCEDLSEVLLYSVLVASPWAFGTTQLWAIWTLNLACYLLGILLSTKLILRKLKGYNPGRWTSGRSPVRPTTSLWRVLTAATLPSDLKDASEPKSVRRLFTSIGIINGALLAYILVSAVNARAVFDPVGAVFQYREHLTWLPHSLDGSRTWPAFWNALAMSCCFWSLWDWLLGKTSAEETRGYQAKDAGPGAGAYFPARLRRLLWLLTLNGALMAAEGIIQRIEGSGRLLFLVQPSVNPAAETQFGPYAYRANAAAYFNLVWPLALGFWWTLHRAGGSRKISHHFVLLAAMLMAASPVISTSRGGMLVDVGMLVVGSLFLLGSQLWMRAVKEQGLRSRRIAFICVVCFCAGSIALGFSLGWARLKPRMAQINEGFEDREAMYERARPMASDYPFFGTGPGTFESVFQLYRKSTETYWPAQLHNDWLETRITYGWIGMTLFGFAFLCVVARWFIPTGIHGGRRFTALTCLALTGCLVHARFDFPFQVYSIQLLFLAICAVLLTLSRRPSTA